MGTKPVLVHRNGPALRDRIGKGVSIAVIDSGFHPGHPHLGPIAGGVGLTPDGDMHDDLVDRLGHGTAVTAAIQEKAPGAEVFAVRVFHEVLATSARTLAQAIDWASDEGCRLVNLSLGTPHAFRAEDLGPAISRAVERGTIVIAAFEHEGEPWLPGSLPGAIGVRLDWEVPRDAVRIESRGTVRALFASGYPRPISGVPPERNLKGISFAVANATGMIALALEGHPDARTSGAAITALSV